MTSRSEGVVIPCPDGPHRGPQGPNEDVALCPRCFERSWELRPEGETYGWHLADCSLPERHEGYCQSGGEGHLAAPLIRGYWPRDPRSQDFIARTDQDLS
jgi:hypothetical protein